MYLVYALNSKPHVEPQNSHSIWRSLQNVPTTTVSNKCPLKYRSTRNIHTHIIGVIRGQIFGSSWENSVQETGIKYH